MCWPLHFSCTCLNVDPLASCENIKPPAFRSARPLALPELLQNIIEDS